MSTTWLPTALKTGSGAIREPVNILLKSFASTKCGNLVVMELVSQINQYWLLLNVKRVRTAG